MVADGGVSVEFQVRLAHDGSGGEALGGSRRELLLGQLFLAVLTPVALLAVGAGRAHAGVLGREKRKAERVDDAVATHGESWVEG